jgi:hypothetical protein
MMRSLAVPAWGQATNGQSIKALIVAAGEGYLLYHLFTHERERRDAKDKITGDPDRAAHWESRAEYHRERRNDFTWWSAFAIALSMGDAYVDAHLRYVDVEFKARDAGENEDMLEIRLSLEWPF